MEAQMASIRRLKSVSLHISVLWSGMEAQAFNLQNFKTSKLGEIIILYLITQFSQQLIYVQK